MPEARSATLIGLSLKRAQAPLQFRRLRLTSRLNLCAIPPPVQCGPGGDFYTPANILHGPVVFPWLSSSILVPIEASLLIPFIPDKGDGRQIRWYAPPLTLVTYLLTVGGYLNGYDPSVAGLQLVERVQ